MPTPNKIIIYTYLACVLVLTNGGAAEASSLDWLLFWKKPRLVAPHVSSSGKLVRPPGESSYFPVREDGQPYMLNVDTTVNMTETINQFYYDPKWRGEVWVPFDQFSAIERGTRAMATWKEYDEFSELRKFNKIHKFFERSSGFGP